jgi:hypothetical protein
MGTYLNAYEIASQVRYGINEHSDAFMQATDTSGAFSNSEILRKINDAQRYIWNILLSSCPDIFLTSTSVTAVSSVLTLPADVFKIKSIEDASNIPLYPIDSISKNVGFLTSGYYQYYQKGSTLVIDVENINDTFTFWYYSRCRDLDFGMSSAGGALSLTLATSARRVADYYNGMSIENVTDDWIDTISDYSAARVATIAVQTGAASKYYGLVSELPEVFHFLIPERALLLLKQNPKSPEKVTPADVAIANDNLSSALRAYAGTMNTDRMYFFEDFR